MAALPLAPPSPPLLLKVPSIDPNRCEESHLSGVLGGRGSTKVVLLLAIYNKQ